MRGVPPPPPQLSVPCPQGMILQISGSLPSLSGMEMACDYGNNIRTMARVPGPAFGHQIAYCNLLPRDQFPPFPPHQGKHLTHWAVSTATGALRWLALRGAMADSGTGVLIAASNVGGDPLPLCPSLPGSRIHSRPRGH